MYGKKQVYLKYFSVQKYYNLHETKSWKFLMVIKYTTTPTEKKIHNKEYVLLPANRDRHSVLRPDLTDPTCWSNNTRQRWMRLNRPLECKNKFVTPETVVHIPL